MFLYSRECFSFFSFSIFYHHVSFSLSSLSLLAVSVVTNIIMKDQDGAEIFAVVKDIGVMVLGKTLLLCHDKNYDKEIRLLLLSFDKMCQVSAQYPLLARQVGLCMSWVPLSLLSPLTAHATTSISVSGRFPSLERVLCLTFV